MAEKIVLVGKELKMDLCEHYGGARCHQCGDDNLDHLRLDHIHDDGVVRRDHGEPSGERIYGKLRNLGYPQYGDFQVTCDNCNKRRIVQAPGMPWSKAFRKAALERMARYPWGRPTSVAEWIRRGRCKQKYEE